MPRWWVTSGDIECAVEADDYATAVLIALNTPTTEGAQLGELVAASPTLHRRHTRGKLYSLAEHHLVAAKPDADGRPTWTSAPLPPGQVIAHSPDDVYRLASALPPPGVHECAGCGASWDEPADPWACPHCHSPYWKRES